MDRAIVERSRARGAVLSAALAAVCLIPAVAFAQLEAPTQLDPGEAPPQVQPPPPPPPPGSQPVPLSFNDAAFASASTSGAIQISGCQTRSNLSITENGPDASVKGGCFTLDNTRISSAEAIRAGGGDITLNWVWAEADARTRPGDHADGLQCYGSGGNITVNNTTFRAYNSNATAGYFAADGWHGIHRFNNVLFWGGPYGLRVEADGGEGVYLNNVYFVQGSFGYAPFRINMPILQWQNVYWVTIQNGKMVIGDPIPHP
jgi:hypothetical protein